MSSGSRYRAAALLALATLVASCHHGQRRTISTASGSNGTSHPPIVRGIDHFFATSPDPEPLYRFFRDTLQLPEVYPFRNYGDFTSGLVSAGNVLFEVVTWAVPPGERLPTEFKGLAFDPDARLAETMSRFQARGIQMQKPDTVWSTNDAGVRTVGYVNIGLDGPNGLPPHNASIFINDNLGNPRAALRRTNGAAELERRGGGALGVSAVAELLIGVEDLDQALAEWRMLGGSGVSAAPGVITWPIGPRMRFVRSERAGIHEMLFKVRSLESARAFLAARGMLADAQGRTCIAPHAVGGLRICMVE